MRGLVSVLGVLAASPELVLPASFISISLFYQNPTWAWAIWAPHIACRSPWELCSHPDSESPGHFLGPPTHPLQGPLEGKGLRNRRWFGCVARRPGGSGGEESVNSGETSLPPSFSPPTRGTQVSSR